MTRVVELLIAVNALAGIAAFLGLRRIVRRWPRKKIVVQPTAEEVGKQAIGSSP